jgi:hypothetical protein
VSDGKQTTSQLVAIANRDRQSDHGRSGLYSDDVSQAALPTYRVLTGPDDETFCRRVSDALAIGYELHSGPAVTFDGERVIVAQAVVWPHKDRPTPSSPTPHQAS